eukprot:scaffold20590_cov107-Isochrysis_galbana.AAC.2
MIGRAPGGKVKGGGGKGGKASLPGDSRVSRRIRPLALLIFKFFLPGYRLVAGRAGWYLGTMLTGGRRLARRGSLGLALRGVPGMISARPRDIAHLVDPAVPKVGIQNLVLCGDHDRQLAVSVAQVAVALEVLEEGRVLVDGVGNGLRQIDGGVPVVERHFRKLGHRLALRTLLSMYPRGLDMEVAAEMPLRMAQPEGEVGHAVPRDDRRDLGEAQVDTRVHKLGDDN